MAPPTRTDDQILPHIRWVPIGKSNCYLDVEKSQSNPIYKIAMHILKHTNFFRAFAASSTIPSIYIQLFWDRKHKFHLRPDSPLHFPNEEPVLGYLKFSAKGTKREVFGMPIPYNLITTNIQGEPYYKEYLEKVSKHQRYLAGEKGSDPDSPAPKPAKATKKSKPSAPKAYLRPPVTIQASSQQPKPKPAPAKSQGKKHKLVTKTSNKPSPGRRSKPGLVTKRRKPTSSLRLVDESVDEGIPEKELRFDDEESDVQRALEESLKSVYDAPWGPLPPVVIRESESGKYQPLLEKPKKKSPIDQYIFQRRTSTPTKSSGHDESSSLYVELRLTDSEVEYDKDVPRIDAGVQDESQDGPNPGFTTTAYPKVQENLKLTVKEHVILEEPASSTWTLSSLQHLAKDLSFGDLFFNDKPSDVDNEKTTAKIEVESMVSVIIQQDTSAIPPMTTPIIDLTSRPESPNVSKAVDEIVTDAVDWAIQASLRNRFRDLPEAYIKEILHQRMWETNSYKDHEYHMMLYEDLEKSMNRGHTDELFKDLAEAHKMKKKRRDSPKTPSGSPPHQPPPPPPPAGPSRTSGSPRASGSSQVSPPPPPPPSTNQEGQSHGSIAPSSSKTAASAEYKAWTMTDTRLRLSVSSIEDLRMDDDMAPDAQVQSSDDKEIRNAHIPKVNLRQDWWKSLEEDRLAAPEPAWSIPSSDVPIPKNNWASALAKLLPLGGPPGQVTIQFDFFFNKDLEYLRYGSKGSRPVLSILKIKAAYYPDVGLEQMVPDQIHTSEGDRRVVRTHTWILSVVRIEVFSIAVTFWDKYGVRMIMWFNEIHKFSDGTLHQIDKALDYRVKEFKVNRMNLGLNIRFWIRKDMDRIKEFMFSIQKRLKTRRIFCNLESFIGGRLKDLQYSFRNSDECYYDQEKCGHAGPKGNPQQALKDKGVIDSGCSRHMTGNISFLSKFEEIDGGYVAFGGNPKGGKISDTECVVLSYDYKLSDENHVLLRVPRENNMYNVDLKNVVPSGGLTCLFAKATLDESNLWHRRLGHINCKTMNKLDKGNLFYGMKGIKREFNVARTPQQNKVAERKNITLIEAARTMLADSLLPISFWAEAVNTVCYVQNKNVDDDVVDAALDVKENENDVHVSANESDKTNNKKHDEKAKRDDKGKKNLHLWTPSKYPDDPDMPELEDIVYLDDEEDVGAKADLSNLETNIPVSPIPTTRVHKDHHVNQIISDLTSAPQTRSTTRMVKEQGGLHQINDEDFHTCMFTCFLSQEEPKKVLQPLKYPSWIEAIQEELLQFKQQKVWVLADLPKGKRVIGLKWVFMNKKYERGIVIRNKARLVAQGHTQEEGINYDEVFAPVARIEAIRLFFAYASFMGFMIYHMDVKSAFLYETIEEEAYVCQPPGFEDPDYPDKVYKVVKALYGLHQAPRAWYETLANYLLENSFQRGKIDQTLFKKKQKRDIFLVQVYVDDIIFRSTNKELCKAFEKLMKDKFQMNVKSASTPIETKKHLLKDPDGEDVDVYICRSMIGSLMYLTSSRPDIMFAVCACARFQVTPKVSHLHAVKRIFRYLKGKPHLGLWYPRNSPFNLVAYSDSDYAEASLDRKSTTGVLVKHHTSNDHQFIVSNRHQELTSPEQMASELTIPKQTALGKEISNPFMAGSLPKTIWRMHPNREKIAAIDADEDVNAASKGVSAVSAPELVSAAEPTVFNDEDVTMTMAQTLIKLKAKKAKLLDEQIAQKLHDEEVRKAAARDKQEKAYMERAPRASKTSMVGYKMEFFRGMTYDNVRPIFERETKSLTVPSEDKEKALWVELKRLFKPDADDVLWKLQRYMHAPLTWKLYGDCEVHHVSLTKGHDIFMLIEKDFPLLNVVMILMLSGKLQVEEDNEMARDLVMKIFMEANKPRSRSLDTSS
nr:putative ribonuclease H-like domain-containing protein [Tanacetum cinerariifolium]